MSNQIGNPNDKKIFDLEERTAKFGVEVVRFAKVLVDGTVNRPLIGQLVRSGTSVGANYMEADCAESKKDFCHKIGIARKESNETRHWLRMIAEVNPDHAEACRRLWREAHELTLIFSSILRSSRR